MATLSLSEAIRQGAKIRPQYFGSYAGFVEGGDSQVGSCALGAALEAEGALRIATVASLELALYFDHEDEVDVWPILRRMVSAPPCGCDGDEANRTMEVADVIAHLNDDHHWRRETIACWVQHVEEGK